MRRAPVVTIKDVARRAGVAWSTASYALNGGPKPVSADVRERVLAAAADLGYSSNLLARGLVTGRAQALGVVVRDLNSPIAVPQLAGAEAAAQERGYKVLLATHQQEPDRALAAFKDLSARRVDGILSLSGTANMHPAIIDSLAATGLPYVTGFHVPEPRVQDDSPADVVLADQIQGGALATRHLMNIGREQIAFLGGPISRSATTERLQGFRHAHSEVGRAPEEKWILFADDIKVAPTMQVARELLKRPAAGIVRGSHQVPNAIFVITDLMAGGVLRVCHELNIKVPDDIAIVGFDNFEWAEVLDPPLTSVEMPLEEIGYTCATRLIERLEKPDLWQPRTIHLPCRLVRRESA